MVGLVWGQRLQFIVRILGSIGMVRLVRSLWLVRLVGRLWLVRSI